MTGFIDAILGDTPVDMAGEATPPPASHLFQVNKNATPVDAATGDISHTVVAKRLYL